MIAQDGRSPLSSRSMRKTRRVHRWKGLALVAGLSAFGAGQASATERLADCRNLVHLNLIDATVIRAEPEPVGRWRGPDGTVIAKVAGFCRVVVTARPSRDSNIGIEVWLPAPGAWNGRFWGVGNGTWAGYINYRGLAARVNAGFAAVSTDTGHQAAPDDSTWARGHPEKVIDYGHRAVHLAAVLGKAVTAGYYGHGATKAYFGACSTGGRHGLMLAQRYPGDYDGIIAGDPDYDSTRLYSGIAQVQSRWIAEPARALPAAKVPALHGAVLAACDAADGARDGVIDHPPACRFDPAVLACKGAETDACLTPPQVESVRELYAGLPRTTAHRSIPRLAHGTEPDWDWVQLGEGPGTSGMFDETVGFFSNLVYEDPAWDFKRYDPAHDDRRADRRLGSVLNANSPDLSAFARRGGKLILYQGWADPVVAAQSTIDYHDRVVARIGDEAARSSLRLFLAPGMGHCTGGPGPNQFGQTAGGDADPETSLNGALQRWVEQGVAPERIVASKRAVDRDAASELIRTRPLCAWPAVARYKGSGSTDSAASYECTVPSP